MMTLVSDAHVRPFPCRYERRSVIDACEPTARHRARARSEVRPAQRWPSIPRRLPSGLGSVGSASRCSLTAASGTAARSTSPSHAPTQNSGQRSWRVTSNVIRRMMMRSQRLTGAFFTSGSTRTQRWWRGRSRLPFAASARGVALRRPSPSPQPPPPPPWPPPRPYRWRRAPPVQPQGPASRG